MAATEKYAIIQKISKYHPAPRHFNHGASENKANIYNYISMVIWRKKAE